MPQLHRPSGGISCDADLILPRAIGQTASGDESTTLDVLLQKILSPYLSSQEEPGRLVVSGPAVVVGARAPLLARRRSCTSSRRMQQNMALYPFPKEGFT
jgi:hypothetical protein